MPFRKGLIGLRLNHASSNTLSRCLWPSRSLCGGGLFLSLHIWVTSSGFSCESVGMMMQKSSALPLPGGPGTAASMSCGNLPATDRWAHLALRNQNPHFNGILGWLVSKQVFGEHYFLPRKQRNVRPQLGITGRLRGESRPSDWSI